MPKQYHHTVIVRGRGGKRISFPIDMLRYDRLTPDSELDSGKINESVSNFGRDEAIGYFVLCREADRNWTPTEGRWESFMYEVMAHTVRDYQRGVIDRRVNYRLMNVEEDTQKMLDRL